MQKQESGSPPIDNDPVDVENDPTVDTHTVDSPVQHTTDGKKIIYPFYLFAMIMNLKKLILVDTNVENSEPIQPDITDASSVVPSLQIDAITEKVLYPFHRSFRHKLIQSS